MLELKAGDVHEKRLIAGYVLVIKAGGDHNEDVIAGNDSVYHDWMEGRIVPYPTMDALQEDLRKSGTKYHYKTVEIAEIVITHVAKMTPVTHVELSVLDVAEHERQQAAQTTRQPETLLEEEEHLEDDER